MNGVTTSNVEYQGKAYSVTTEMYFNQNYGEKPKKVTKTEVIIAHDIQGVLDTIRDKNFNKPIGLLGSNAPRPSHENIIAIGYITDVNMIAPQIKQYIYRSEKIRMEREEQENTPKQDMQTGAALTPKK